MIVDYEKIHYQTNLQINNSTQGASSGTIRYKKGFYITYNGNVNFNEIDLIGGLKIEGLAHVQGFTKGNSKRASAYTKLTKGENIWLNDYTLGNIDTEIWYKKSILSLKNFKGRMVQSSYAGEAFINLKTKI